MTTQLFQSRSTHLPFWLLLSLLPSLTIHQIVSAADRQVILGQVPDDGIQPRLINDNVGNTHLIYFKREQKTSRLGQLFYRQYVAGINHSDAKTSTKNDGWSPPTQISTTRFKHHDAIGKASFAIDDSGRIHVAWFTSSPSAYNYSRSNPDRTEFEQQRRLNQSSLKGVEVEPSIAVHQSRVTVTWHAGDMADESSRQVYAVTSSNGGDTFRPAAPISNASLGVCGCCAMASRYDDKGKFQLVYRAAVQGEGRHLMFLDNGQTQAVSNWKIGYCPVSSTRLNGNWLVFETRDRILQWNTGLSSPPHPVMAITRKTRQKHPDIAVNHLNERLIVWGEGGGYVPGGQLSMALYDVQGNQIPFHLDNKDTKIQIPDNSVVSAATLKDGSFLVLY